MGQEAVSTHIVQRSGTNAMYSPSFSRTVAYLEFARGQLCLLHKPVTLYSFRQKFCVAVLDESWPVSVLATREVGDHVLDFVRTELSIDHRPDHVVALHSDAASQNAGK